MEDVSSANEQARRMNKKTIQPKDVMDAIHEIEFDMFLPRLEGELTSTSLQLLVFPRGTKNS
jgi:DNA polymerase epsilon subunit 3